MPNTQSTAREVVVVVDRTDAARDTMLCRVQRRATATATATATAIRSGARARAPVRAALAWLLATTPAATAQDATAWLQDGVGLPTRAMTAGIWTPTGGLVHATDPVTLWQTGPGSPLIAVPEAPARVVGLIDRTSGRTAAMALVWSDAPVVCGEDLATIGVDTGLAGFLTPADVAALEAYADPSFGTYHGTYADQLDAQAPTLPLIAELPGGARFPVSGSGWGDGGYPVAGLRDASGAMVALYAQFDSGTGDWHLPEPCEDTPRLR